MAVGSALAIGTKVSLFPGAWNRITCCCCSHWFFGGYYLHRSTATDAARIFSRHAISIGIVVEGVSICWHFIVDGCHQLGKCCSCIAFNGAESFWFESKTVETKLVGGASIPSLRLPTWSASTLRCNCCCFRRGLRCRDQAPTSKVSAAKHRSKFGFAGSAGNATAIKQSFLVLTLVALACPARFPTEIAVKAVVAAGTLGVCVCPEPV